MSIGPFDDNIEDDGNITTTTSETITNLNQLNTNDIINNNDNNNDSDSSLSSGSDSIQSSTKKTYVRRKTPIRSYNHVINHEPKDQNEEESDEDEEEKEEEEYDSESLQKITEKRQLIKELLDELDWKEGDYCYMISKHYLDLLFNEPVKTWQQLVDKVGPIDSHLILDQNENLYSINEESNVSIPVSEQIFRYLKDWFQIIGIPVQRNFIYLNEELIVERWPLTFSLHQIGKKQQQSYFRSGRYNNNHDVEETPLIFPISRTSTFLFLIESIRYYLKLSKKPIEDFRLWFIVTGDDSNSIPYLITPQNFIFNIKGKCTVDKSFYDFTLGEKVNDQYFPIHIVIEYKEKANSEFPIDQYIKTNTSSLQDDNNNNTSVGGHMGLSNLGNTCYMNSALQCLLHVPEINQYFFQNIYQGELNLDNPLGYNGDVANAFGSLLKQAFDPHKTSSSISPREFKSTIGRYSSMFSGYLQQDSQELLSWLLDALHEDLNRIHKKPYCEKPELNDDDIKNSEAIINLANTCWHQHKQRNDSVIIDLFTGLYQSTLVCPDCEKTSITFDPFNDLTLPLPISKKWYHTFTIVDLSPEAALPQRIMKLEVELNKTSNYEDLLNYFSNFLKIDNSNLFIYEIFQHGIYQDFQVDRVKNKFIPIGDLIRDTDEITVYIIPNNPEEDIIVPVFNVAEDEDTSYRMSNFFGIPLFSTLNKDQLNSFGYIRQKLLTLASILTTYDLSDEYEKHKKTVYPDYVNKNYYSKSDFKYITFENDDVPKNEQAMDDVENDGYDSDVSLADPYVNSEYGFKVKYIQDYSSKSWVPQYKSRYHLNNTTTTTKQQPERLINVPLHKPTVSDFQLLSDQLPEPKKSYYRYSEDENKPNQEPPITTDEEMSASNSPEVISLQISDKSDENEGFVVVDKLDNTTKKFPTTTFDSNDEFDSRLVQQRPLPPPLPLRSQLLRSTNSSDEETESENNYGNLFGSNSNLPEPPASNPYSESLKPSNVNSPIEPNYDEEVPQQEQPQQQQPQENQTLVNKNSILLCEWDKTVYDNLFGSDTTNTLLNIEKLSNPELENNKAKYQKLKKAKITLDECLKSFSTPEILGEQDLWYCPRCKSHKRATKTIQLWSTGDILTIHLKRFHSARAFSDKIDSVVDFPIEGLDISSYVANPTIKDGDCIYDLIAVDNHYGGLGGGHYTASVKNFKDSKWYYFNDSRVTEIENPNDVISSAAYLLFYRKRTTTDKLGGEKLNQLLIDGDIKFKYELAQKQDSITKIEHEIIKFQKSFIEEDQQQQEDQVDVSTQDDVINYDELLDDIDNQLNNSVKEIKVETPVTPPTDEIEPIKDSKEEIELQQLTNTESNDGTELSSGISSGKGSIKKQRTLSKHGDDIVKRQKMSSSPIKD
ncbi:hypothetical protein KGF54_004403 [Candida jiufengensis]|uniref:uncharacterized protein n=1 Tax=Candida jiufengensis TaxID=497108 RepID=UPI0022254DBF|nr:uncharacterized protein KGF54_004403 [Candida jiufengensis]KAI5951329.1 hypothetical protein KGF54_004403 [Candida jiufengensis]